MTAPAYRYRCVINRVVDGDTLRADCDLGFNVWVRGISFRLLGLDCPEIDTDAGKAAKAFTEGWLERNCKIPGWPGWEVVADTVKADKYGGRWDARIFTPLAAMRVECLNDALLAAGHAVPVKWQPAPDGSAG